MDTTKETQLWDEKNLIGQEKRNLNNIERLDCDTTTKTENQLMTKPCNDIGKRKRAMRRMGWSWKQQLSDRPNTGKDCHEDWYNDYRVNQLSKRYKVSNACIIETLKQESCQICGSTKKLCIDHCHNSGVVRGRLCSRCNSGLGFFNDDITKLNSAIDYLGKSVSG